MEYLKGGIDINTCNQVGVWRRACVTMKRLALCACVQPPRLMSRSNVLNVCVQTCECLLLSFATLEASHTGARSHCWGRSEPGASGRALSSQGAGQGAVLCRGQHQLLTQTPASLFYASHSW